MLDKTNSGRPERRSALIAHELQRLDVVIAALSEVRFLEEGSLKEHGAGYTLYWSGKSKGIDASQVIYAPTLQAEPADKEKFYSDLRSFLQSTPTEDKIFILGDFNARVGRDSDTWKGALGKHGIGNCNDNGRLLLELCAEQQLVITNTIFQQKDSLKTTVMASAECHTDHRLVRCKLNLQFKPKPRKGGPPKRKISVGSLQSSEIRASFQANIQTRIEGSSYSIDSSPEVFWE
ncbi:craniofacial development protein 2-like [Amphiura filiformis]|uniref:craniofacial development protein 2-like n=1 Tax=Amphiura filiformis TaxID=82378 RepID=UPI003B210779